MYSKALVLLSAFLFKLEIPEFLQNDLATILTLAPNFVEVFEYLYNLPQRK